LPNPSSGRSLRESLTHECTACCENVLATVKAPSWP
jgi:hypothetical protein